MAKLSGMALFADATVRSLSDFVTILGTVGPTATRWFRGQARSGYTLVPSLARRGADWLDCERTLRSRFEQNAAALVPVIPRSDWDWLLLMQHYGVPTRLLDWSENPLVALYFATVGIPADARYDSAVWVLDPVALNRSSAIGTPFDDIPILDVDDELQPYSPGPVATAVASLGPVAVLAKRQFARMVAQSGVFTVVHRDKTPLETIRAGQFVGKIVIPRADKRRIAKELRSVGVTRLSMFPELESVASVARSFV